MSGVWISRKRFEAILQALTFTDQQPSNFIDKFWEVCQMLEAWGRGGGGGGGGYATKFHTRVRELPR